MGDAIAAIEGAYREQAAGRVIIADRINLPLPNGWIRLMPAVLLDSGVLGYKEFHLTRIPDTESPYAEVRYTFQLFDYATGALLATLDANYLTAVRTGATAGVALKYLAPPDSTDVGLIGSGAEARTELAAVAAVRDVRRVKVYSRDATRREQFAAEMSAVLGLDVRPVASPTDAIADVAVLLVATNTGGTGPALLGKWLRPGLHVNSVGSTLPAQREIDLDVWSAADPVVVDTRRVLDESGDSIAAHQGGVLDESKVVELGDLVAGTAAGRTSPEQITLYKSVGAAIQDVAVASYVYTRARAAGLGREVADYHSVKRVDPN
jgi:ornithine cyclodeaminase/alanine dehydrogenase